MKKKKVGLLVKIKGRMALAKLKRAQKRGTLPKNSLAMYKAIRRAGLG